MGIREYTKYANAYGQPSHKMRDQTYPAVGFCIYCLDRSIPDAELTLEHIIANALSGTLRLPKSACRKCAEYGNKKFEQPALNSSFLLARLLLQLRAQGKKTSRPLPPVALGCVDISGTNTDIFDTVISIDEHPKALVFVVFPEAGFLSGIDSPKGLSSLRLSFTSIQSGFKSSPLERVSINSDLNFTALAYALAKIAYAYAVAERGIHGFEGDAIRKLLTGERSDIFNFVGSPQESSKRKYQELHRLSFSVKNGILVVLVHLFSSYGVRPYEVAVGKLLRL